MTRRQLSVAGILFSAALWLAGCGSGAPVSALTLVVRDGVYAPVTLEAPSGRRIDLTLDNQDGEQHQLAIFDIPLATQGEDDPGMAGMPGMAAMPAEQGEGAMPPVHILAPAGTRQMVSFVPTRSGDFTVRCLEPGHTESATLTLVRPG